MITTPQVLLIDGYELLLPLDHWVRDELLAARPAEKRSDRAAAEILFLHRAGPLSDFVAELRHWPAAG